MDCLLCGKKMKPGDGAASDGMACDECIERNGWDDFNKAKESPLVRVVQCPECGGMGHPAAECDNMG